MFFVFPCRQLVAQKMEYRTCHWLGQH